MFEYNTCKLGILNLILTAICYQVYSEKKHR